jgi:hypothetical protein
MDLNYTTPPTTPKSCMSRPIFATYIFHSIFYPNQCFSPRSLLPLYSFDFLKFQVKSSQKQEWEWWLHYVVIIYPWDFIFQKLFSLKRIYFTFFSKDPKTLLIKESCFYTKYFFSKLGTSEAYILPPNFLSQK